MSAPIAEERRTGFKKIFMKLGQHVGIVKTSEFSKEYLDAVKDADQYKASLVFNRSFMWPPFRNWLLICVNP